MPWIQAFYGSSSAANVTPPPPKQFQGGGGGGVRRGGGARNPRLEGEGDIPNAMVYHPSYNETRWKVLIDKVYPMRVVMKITTSLGGLPLV